MANNKILTFTFADWYFVEGIYRRRDLMPDEVKDWFSKGGFIVNASPKYRTMVEAVNQDQNAQLQIPTDWPRFRVGPKDQLLFVTVGRDKKTLSYILWEG